MFKEISRLWRFIFLYLNGIVFYSRTAQESYERHENVKRLVIVGLPRSGTSAFIRLVNNINGVLVLYESSFSPVFVRCRRVMVNYYYEVAKQIKFLSNDNSIPLTSLYNYSFFGDKIIFDSSRYVNQQLTKGIKAADLDRVIFLVRDPRSVYTSYLKWVKDRNTAYVNTSPVKSKDVERFCAKWNKYIEYFDKYYSNDNVLVVKYEDVVTDEMVVRGEILKFLGLSQSDFISSDALMKTDSLTKWQELLSIDEKDMIIACCGKNMRKLGYHADVNS
ncbi:sulfotransferase family protein [Amphritea sp. HPY]|uniref:sulfotransferase family protein n=1 Tax=Amphritea sp. HPY TaxID=3421652 RepID=UPI003D7C56A6